MKIASVATPELATRQLKKSQKNNREKLNELNFSRFFSEIFQLSRQFKGGYTLRFLSRVFIARWRRDKNRDEKSHGLILLEHYHGHLNIFRYLSVITLM